MILQAPPPPAFERARSGLYVPRPQPPVLPVAIGYLGAARGAARGVTPAGGGGSPPVIEAQDETGATTGSKSFTVPSGCTKLVVFAVRSSTAVGSITSVDHGSDALTYINDIVSGGFPECGVELWERDNPTAQTANLVVTGPSQYFGWIAYALSGAGNREAYNETGGTSGELTVALTTLTDNALVLGGHSLGRDDTVTQSISSPWSQDASFVINGGSATYRGKGGGASQVKASAGSVTLDWVLTGTPNRMAMIIAAYPPA